MVVGLGCDIVEVHRFHTWIENDVLLKRYFTSQELKYLEEIPEHLALQRVAGMFAAKESFIKAVNARVTLTDIIIEKNVNGSPKLRVERNAKKMLEQVGGSYTWVSIAHEKSFAIAVVVIEC